MKKRHMVVKTSTKNQRISKKEMFQDKERRFTHELSASTFINKEIVKMFQNKFPKMKKSKMEETLNKMTKENKK